MSSKKETTYYIELQPGDAVQDGDQWLDSFGQWQPYVCKDQISGVVFSGVKARRPIRTTHQTTYEEVPGSRTTQQAIDQPQRERIAYEDLQPGDIIQEGDEWRSECGRWQQFVLTQAKPYQVRDSLRVRRPHNITALQNERDELQTALRESHAAHAFTTKQGLQACKDRDEACRERDLARSELARLSTELWARKPLEERVASLTEELAQAREASQQSLKTITDNADTFVDQVTVVERERDEARAERDRLQGVVDNLYNEPTARQVQDMLRTWATELDWSAGCFGSFGRSQIDIIQQTMVAVIQRIETMLNPEGGSDDE